MHKAKQNLIAIRDNTDNPEIKRQLRDAVIYMESLEGRVLKAQLLLDMLQRSLEEN